MQEFPSLRVVECPKTILDQIVVRARTVEEKLMKTTVVDLVSEKCERVVELRGFRKRLKPFGCMAHSVNQGTVQHEEGVAVSTAAQAHAVSFAGQLH